MFKNNDGVDIYNSKSDNEWEDKVKLGIKTMHHLPPSYNKVYDLIIISVCLQRRTMIE